MKFQQRILSIALFFAFVLTGISAAFAQVNENDPLGTTRTLIQEEEVLFTFTENVKNGPGGNFQISSYNPSSTGTTLDFINGSNNNTAANVPSRGGATSTVAGYFLGGEFGQGIARAFVGKNGTSDGVYLTIEFNKEFTSGTPGSLPINTDLTYVGDVFTPSGTRQDPDISLVAGNFDTDPEEELAVIYPDANDDIMMAIYDIAITQFIPGYLATTPVLKQTVWVAYTNYNTKIFKGIAGAEFDMNGDGIDEIAVVTSAIGGASISLGVFERKGDSTYGFRGNPVTLFNLQTPPCGTVSSYTFSNFSMDIASGEMNSQLPGEELVVAAHFGLTGGAGSAGSNEGLYVFPIGSTVYPNTGYQGIYTTWCQNGSPFYYTNTQFLMSDEEIAIDVATGDMDGDLDAEVVVGTSAKVFVFDDQTNTAADGIKYMSFNEVATIGLTSAYTNNQIGGEARFADDFLDVGNIDPLTGNFGSDFRAEILIAKNFPLISDPINGDISQRFELSVYGFDESGAQGSIDWNTPVLRKQLTDLFPSSSGLETRHFSAIFADIDGGSVILGTPRRTDISDVLNPSIILNAPPTHFDVFDGNVYDVSNLYAAGEPTPPASVNHYFSSYEQIANQSGSFSTSFTSDWAVSASVSAGLDLSVFSLGAKMEQTYGERFSSLQENSSEQEITQLRTAFADDELLAYLVDYAVFEYPVFRQGESTELTHVVVVVPTDIKETFIGARNPIHTYRPTHQHGNLFSYPTDVSELEVFPTASQIYADALKSQSINKTSGFNAGFSVTQVEASGQSVETEITTSTTVGASIGGAFKGVGLSVEVEGNYNTSAIQNSTMKYRQEVTLASYLGQGELSTIPGDYPYTVTPLVYWDANGSLVLDYLVDISKFEFWQNNYNSYDPAFLLLNPHKVEKGQEADTSYNSSDRFRTRDIYFSSLPAPGDTVTVFARVFNYGFLEIPAGSVTVDFYYNDPAGADTLIHISTETIGFGFQGRDDGLGKNIVSTSWAVPASLGPDTKVIAIIDGDNSLPNEIHDYPNGNGVSNNIGWTCAFVPNCNVPTTQNMFFPDGITSTDDFLTASVSAYPNPFDQQITLGVELLQQDEITVSVFTLQGQLIHQELLPATTGYQQVTMDTESWAEGMYVYQVQGQKTFASGKLVLRR